MTREEFAAAYMRLLQVFGVNTQVQLAECLGVKQSSVADAKKRHSIPDGWLLTALMHKAVNPSWVLRGQGGQYLQPSDGKPFFVQADGSVRLFSTEELVAEIVRRLPGCNIRITDAQGGTI